MGRPINKRYFGANVKNNLRVQFYNGSASVAGAIVKQTGSKRFVCVDASGTEATCKLVSKADGDLAAGEMSITVKNDAGTSLYVRKITAHKVTGSDGIAYKWSFSASTSDGAVQVEEAGDDDTFTGNVDLS